MKLQNDNIFFTSDSHFFHGNIIKYCQRPFESVEEMNETLIMNWNNKISPQDTVFFLGDFGFASSDKIKEVLERLNGNIHLCRGNHDKPLNSLYKYFVSVFDLKTILVPDEEISGGYRAVVLCHFPLLSWDRQYYKSIHLHGHVHSKTGFIGPELRYDVGVDNNNFSPVSYKEIKELINK